MAPHRSTSYRKKLKLEDPNKYEEYLEKQRKRQRERRKALKKELQKKTPDESAVNRHQHTLDLQRVRQRKYEQKKKAERNIENGQKLNLLNICLPGLKPKKKSTHGTRNAIQSKKEYNRIMKQKEREKMSYQKKMWIKKKDRESKAAKRALKKLSCTSNCEKEKESTAKSPFATVKTQYNVTSKVRSTLPQTPTKFAKVIHSLVAKATPRKRKALEKFEEFRVAAKKHKIQEVKKAELERSLKVKRKYRDLGIKARAKQKLQRRSKVDVMGIQKFYMREDISRILPQKRYATKDGPGYAMQVSLKAAHSKYMFENPNKPVSLGKFAALRKRNIRLLSLSHREYCCCIYCVNVRYKLLTLSRAVPNEVAKKTNENDLFGMLLCEKGDDQRFHEPDCINGVCKKCTNYERTLGMYYQQIPEQKTLTWSRWVKTKDKEGYEKRIILTKRGSKHELLKEMVAEDIRKPALGFSFFQHLFTAQWQRMQFNKIKEELPSDTVLQVIDFAKNRSIKYQNEIKACYYTAAQVTMHPVVAYVKDGNNTVRHSCIVISEDNNHDFHAVNKYLEVVNEHISQHINPKRKIVYSDGCSAQYKSRGPFSDIANDSLKMDRNYFGFDHGKSECNGEIGILNKALDRDITSKS